MFPINLVSNTVAISNNLFCESKKHTRIAAILFKKNFFLLEKWGENLKKTGAFNAAWLLK
jgi:hypothetical protein